MSRNNRPAVVRHAREAASLLLDEHWAAVEALAAVYLDGGGEQ
jgi:hypothetical protein